jgi:hypothetical protein
MTGPISSRQAQCRLAAGEEQGANRELASAAQVFSVFFGRSFMYVRFEIHVLATFLILATLSCPLPFTFF